MNTNTQPRRRAAALAILTLAATLTAPAAASATATAPTALAADEKILARANATGKHDRAVALVIVRTRDGKRVARATVTNSANTGKLHNLHIAFKCPEASGIRNVHARSGVSITLPNRCTNPRVAVVGTWNKVGTEKLRAVRPKVRTAVSVQGSR